MIGADIIKVPAKSQPLLGGKTVTDFLSDDTKIYDNGDVVGTLKYVSNYTAFGGDEINGNYFPLTLGDQYKEKAIKVTSKTRVKTETDTEWVLFIKDNDATFRFQNATDGDADIVTLNFKRAILQKP